MQNETKKSEKMEDWIEMIRKDTKSRFGVERKIINDTERKRYGKNG